jgi:glycerol uptake facilitator-like aquaporin
MFIIAVVIFLMGLVQPLFPKQDQSSALFNPALSLMLWLKQLIQTEGQEGSQGKYDWITMVVFMFVQFLGALMAVSLYYQAFPLVGRLWKSLRQKEERLLSDQDNK